MGLTQDHEPTVQRQRLWRRLAQAVFALLRIRAGCYLPAETPPQAARRHEAHRQ
jgi:hypothetical protein